MNTYPIPQLTLAFLIGSSVLAQQPVQDGFQSKAEIRDTRTITQSPVGSPEKITTTTIDKSQSVETRGKITGPLWFDLVSKGIGKIRHEVDISGKQNTNIEMTDITTTTTSFILKHRSHPNQVMRTIPMRLVERKRLSIPVFGKLSAWRKTFLETYPAPFSDKALTFLNPARIALDTHPEGNPEGTGVLMLLKNETYLHHFAQQNQRALFDQVTLIDASTELPWQPPSALEMSRTGTEDLRLMIEPAPNKTLKVRIGYGTRPSTFVGSTERWDLVPYTSYIAETKNARQSPKDPATLYPSDFFLNQQTVYQPGQNWNGVITDLDAISLFHNRQDVGVEGTDGKQHILTLSVTALVGAHSLQALTITIPVPHYFETARLPLHHLNFLGGYFADAKDFVAIGKELTREELLTRPKSAPVATIFKNATLYLKAASFTQD